ncbi:MAG: histidine triad nucleotide-binding protein [Candidatus Gracilibacteria bacterium]|nr:histidine triad nucleotide-binding protein [Candidatus Gracilibacteria bacterium]
MPEENEQISEDCVFCKILNGEIESNLVYSDEEIVAFNDINPKAPIHILIVPRKHIESVAEMERGDEFIVGNMIKVAKILAEENRIGEKGYKLLINVGEEGGQVVPHLHLHLLGGKKLREF